MERRTGPLRRVKHRFVELSLPAGRGKMMVEITHLDQIYYSEKLECGHGLELPILVGPKAHWGDNAERRRCDKCKAENAAKYEAILDTI